MNKVADMTPQPVTVTGVASQPMFNALDIFGFDLVDFQIGMIGTTGSQANPIAVRMLQGQQLDFDDASWVESPTLASFTAGTAYPSYQQFSGTAGLCRYLRWKVATLGGLTSVTFTFRGILRARGG